MLKICLLLSLHTSLPLYRCKFYYLQKNTLFYYSNIIFSVFLPSTFKFCKHWVWTQRLLFQNDIGQLNRLVVTHTSLIVSNHFVNYLYSFIYCGLWLQSLMHNNNHLRNKILGALYLYAFPGSANQYDTFS